MHARFCTYHLEHISHVDADRLRQRSSTLHVKHSHATYVAGEVTLADKLGHDYLVESRRKNIGGISSAAECGYEVFGNNDITQAQGGEHNFAKSPDIHNSRVRVQAL